MDSRRKRSAESLSWIVNSTGAKRHATPAGSRDLQPATVAASSGSAMIGDQLNIEEFGDMDDEEDNCTSRYLPNASSSVRPSGDSRPLNSTRSSHLLNSLKIQYSHLKANTGNTEKQRQHPNVRGSFGRLEPAKEDMQDFSNRAFRSTSTSLPIPNALSNVNLNPPFHNMPLTSPNSPVQPLKSHAQLNFLGDPDKLLPDGSGNLKYPVPNIESFVYDPTMRLRFDPSTGLHYDANARLFYNSVLQIPLYWDKLKFTYLRSGTQHFADKLTTLLASNVSAERSSRDSAGWLGLSERSRAVQDNAGRRRSRSRSFENARLRRSRSYERAGLQRNRSRSGSYDRVELQRSRSRSYERTEMGRSRSYESAELQRSRSRSYERRSFCRDEHSSSQRRMAIRRSRSSDLHSKRGRLSRSIERKYGCYSGNSMDEVSPRRGRSPSYGREPVYGCGRSDSRGRVARYRTRSRDLGRRSSSRLDRFSRDRDFPKTRRSSSSGRSEDDFVNSCLDSLGHQRSREQLHMSYRAASGERNEWRRSGSRNSNLSYIEDHQSRGRKRVVRSRSGSAEVEVDRGISTERRIRRSEGFRARRSGSRSSLREHRLARHRRSDRRESTDFKHCQRKEPEAEERRRHSRSGNQSRVSSIFDDTGTRGNRERSRNEESGRSPVRKRPRMSDHEEKRSRDCKSSIGGVDKKSETKLSTRDRTRDDEIEKSSGKTERHCDEPSEDSNSKSTRSKRSLSKPSVRVTPPKSTRETVGSRSRRSQWEKEVVSNENNVSSKSPRRTVPDSKEEQSDDHHERKGSDRHHARKDSDHHLDKESSGHRDGEVTHHVTVDDCDKPPLTLSSEDHASATLEESLQQDDPTVSLEQLTEIATSPRASSTDKIKIEDARNIITRRRLQRRNVLETEEPECGSLTVKVIIENPTLDAPEKRDKFRLEKSEQVELVQSEEPTILGSIIPPEELSLTIDSLLFNELRKVEKNLSENSDQSSSVLQNSGSELAKEVDPSDLHDEKAQSLMDRDADNVNPSKADVETLQLSSVDESDVLESFIVIDDELDFSGEEDERTDVKFSEDIDDQRVTSTMVPKVNSNVPERTSPSECFSPSDEPCGAEKELVDEEMRALGDFADGEWCVLDEVDDSNDQTNVSQQCSEERCRQNSPDKDSKAKERGVSATDGRNSATGVSEACWKDSATGEKLGVNDPDGPDSATGETLGVNDACGKDSSTDEPLGVSEAIEVDSARDELHLKSEAIEGDSAADGVSGAIGNHSANEKKVASNLPARTTDSYLSDVSSGGVGAHNEDDEKLSILSNISDYDDKDEFVEDQALSDVSSICDEPIDDVDDLSNISSAPEGFDIKDDGRSVEIENQDDGLPEEEENAEDDLISDLLRDEEPDLPTVAEDLNVPSTSVPENPLVPTQDGDSVASRSSPDKIVDCPNDLPADDTLTEERTIEIQEAPAGLQDQPVSESPSTCTKPNARLVRCELMSEETRSPTLTQSKDTDNQREPTSETPVELKIDVKEGTASTVLSNEVNDGEIEGSSRSAADDDCVIVGEPSDDECDVEIVEIENPDPVIIELSDDEGDGTNEEPEAPKYIVVKISTVTEINQWLQGNLSSLERRPTPESFQPVDPAEFVTKWSGTPLQKSEGAPIPVRLKPDNHFTAKFLPNYPTNFVLVRSHVINAEKLYRALVNTLAKQSVTHLVIKRNTGASSGAPYNHCHIIFQSVETAETFYNSCNGLLPLFGVSFQARPAILSFSTGNWVCAHCKRCNFTLRYFCCACYSSREGRDFSPIRLVGTPTRILGVTVAYPMTQSRSLYQIFPGLSDFMPTNSLLPMLDPVTGLSTGLNLLEFQTVSECTKAYGHLSNNKPKHLKFTLSYVLLTNVITKEQQLTQQHVTNVTGGPLILPSNVNLINACTKVSTSTTVGQPIPTISASSSKPIRAKKNAVYSDKTQKANQPAPKPVMPVKQLSKPSKPDGNPRFKYPPPKYSTFRIEPLSGLYFDFQTGLYYHKSTDYFFNDDLCIYLKYDRRRRTYVKVEISTP